MMTENSMEVGLVTHINESQVSLWLMENREEKFFTVKVKEDMLKMGIWIYVSKVDLETSQIGCIMLVATPPVKASIWTDISGIEKTVSVESRIAFSPLEWAKENDYEWFAYSFEFGRVGNFAFNKLLKLNNCQVRRNVMYKAVLIRIPWSGLGRCIVDTFGSLWSILPQVLVLCDDQNDCDKTPWSLPSSDSQLSTRIISSNNVSVSSTMPFVIDELTTCDTLENSNPSDESAEEMFESLSLCGDFTSTVAGPSLDQDHDEPISQPVVYLGVVIVREPQYSIIWGKMHGFVAVCATADLVLEPTNWVEYDCIKIDTELDVSYLAIYCVLSKQKPLMVETYEKSIICHTVLRVPSERKAQTDEGGTYFTMVCDILGDVLVPDIPIVHRCIKNNELKSGVLVRYDVTKKWPCTLFAVYENAILRIIDWKRATAECKIISETDCSLDLKSTECGRDKPQFSDSKKNIVKIAEKETHNESKVFVEICGSPCSDSSPFPNNLPLTAKVTCECSSDNRPVTSTGNIKRTIECDEKPGPSGLSYMATCAARKNVTRCDESFEWLRLKKYTVGTKILTLPVTIMVKLTSTYGILWHINRKLIIVPAEYLGNSAKLGAWLQAKVSPLETTVIDLPYHFIVVRPLEEIENKLMIRKVGDVLQVRVHLEPGVDSYVNVDGKSYLRKNSELGMVSVPSERMPQEYHMKKLRVWVTFMSSGLNSEPTWMVTHRQKLVEVDKDGNELPYKCMTSRLTEVTSTNGGDGDLGMTDDSSMEEVPDM